MASPRSPQSVATVIRRRDVWRAENVPGASVTDSSMPYPSMEEGQGLASGSHRVRSPREGVRILPRIISSAPRNSIIHSDSDNQQIEDKGFHSSGEISL